jgi:hypothetical protein
MFKFGSSAAEPGEILARRFNALSIPKLSREMCAFFVA